MSTSLTGMVPVLYRIEQVFDIQGTLDWIAKYWHVSVYSSIVYVLLVYLGRRWMADRPAYKLRKTLILWNTGLAIFSFFGMMACLPNTLENIYLYGISHTTCHTDCISNSHKHLAIWGWVFALSKIVEFGDTAFIVLRKTPLPFLHWYHHVTVCIFTWYALTPDPSALSQWFGSMNYTVHTAMYTYYALRTSGYRFPSWVPKSVTALQLSQMFMGIFVNLVSWSLARSGKPCMFRYDLFYLSVGMYISYAVLFSNFFYQRYIKRKDRGKATDMSGKGSPPETLLTSLMNGVSHGNGSMWKNSIHKEKLH